MSSFDKKNRFSKLANHRQQPDPAALDNLLEGAAVQVRGNNPPQKTGATEGERALIQIVTTRAVRAEFKALASRQDVKMNDLFLTMFQFWKQHHQ